MAESTEANRLFLQETYRDLLNREPDAEGMQYWLEDLEERGQSREDVVANIKLSDEYRAMDS
tara:strand:+ start:6758 stop:6943 length:186 start_codon:yes stop_codon:yes gene_type:complete